MPDHSGALDVDPLDREVRQAPAPFRLSPESPVLRPFEGAHLLCNVVVNIEHWSLDDVMPRAALPAPQGRSAVPDVANHSWMLYGLRCGLPRLAEALAPLGDAVSVALNASVIDRYPAIADLLEDLGWEVLAHGFVQRSAHAYPCEARMIALTLERIAERFGRPRGWLSPGLSQTDDTLALLRSAGIEFTHDWMIDDRPLWLHTAAGPMIGLPYTVALNDVATYVVEHQPDGALADRALRTLEVLGAETGDGALVMPVGLHPHVIGVPHRIAEVHRIVEAVTSTPGVRAVRSSHIHDWFRQQVPPPGEPGYGS